MTTADFTPAPATLQAAARAIARAIAHAALEADAALRASDTPAGAAARNARANALDALRAQDDPGGSHGTPLDHALWDERDRQREMDALHRQIAELRDALAEANEWSHSLQAELEAARANCVTDADAAELAQAQADNLRADLAETSHALNVMVKTTRELRAELHAEMSEG